MAGLLLSTFLAAIEGTVIGPANPAIVSEFGSVQLMSWVFTAYLLTMAASTPIFGKISDLYGRKPVFLIGSILFLLGSVLCGFAQSMEQLILFRALQGIGAGGLIPVTYTIIGDIYKIEERAKVQGLLSSVWGISSLLGPLIGGYFVDSLSWRWIFGFNVPFGLLSIVVIIKYLHENIERRRVKIDFAGAFTLVIGVMALLIGLALGGQHASWNSPIVISMFAAAVIFIALFLFIEQRAEEPMVPLRLFRVWDIAVSGAAALFVSSLLIGLSSYLPLWVQGVLGENATMSGLVMAPMSIGWMIGSMWGGSRIVTAGSRYTAAIGLSAILLGTIVMAIASHSTPQIVLFVLTFIYGIGFGFSITVFTIIAQSSVGYHLRGASTALNTFLRSLGQTIGAAVFGTWLNVRINQLTASESAGTRRLTMDDINHLLSAESNKGLSADTVKALRQVLEGSLNSLFILMVGIALAGLISVWFLRNQAPSPVDGAEGITQQTERA
ncbi:MDR family MFS transporter [Paenibacillus sediminis]|uniref:EmrB/QacA subfamily drug resistance transporter n=1 Tax=Paenibacillus sediminis TaxID=664909 RepID=A0ABS4H669_9BACL|nr:MDR family MFS transporter [Paenibacillus sediminis]MBP1938043.1 EmrB/QacA subfamily drug resistance transporter [Paenibacillus sediminis]